MNRKSAAWVLASALVVFSLAATAGGVIAIQPTAEAKAPSGCIWKYFGPASGWGLVADGCHGDCNAPAGNGDYLGQQVATPCNGSGSGLSR